MRKKKMFSTPGLVIIGMLLAPIVLGLILLIFIGWLGSPDSLSAKDASSLDRAWHVAEMELMAWDGGRLRDYAPISAHRVEMLRLAGERDGLKHEFHIVCYLRYDIKDRPDAKAAFYCTVDEDKNGQLKVNTMMGPQTSLGDSITFLVSNEKDAARFVNGVRHTYERVETTGVSTAFMSK